MSISITIDNRERGLKALFDSAHESVVYKNLEIGDIIIEFDVAKDGCTHTQSFIFERKTIDDLQASIKDGRYHDQKKRLMGLLTQGCQHHHTSIFYIIEGGCTYSATTDASIKSALINTIIRDGIGVFRTVSLQDTYDLIVSIVKRIREAPEKYSANHASTQRPEEIPHLTPAAMAHNKKESIYVNMLCQIPGVSLKTAKAIAFTYPSWNDIMNLSHVSDEEKLKKLKAITTQDSKGSSRKISSSAAQHIFEALFSRKQ